MRSEWVCAKMFREFKESAGMNLNDKVVLITGGARRLGRQFSLRLAECGTLVVIHYGKSRSDAESLVETIQNNGFRAMCIQGDLADADPVAGLLGRINKIAGTVDILINNAAIFEKANIADTSPESWQRHLDVNLTAPFILSQTFARQLSGREGVIINLLDWRGLKPDPAHLAYTVSKAGLAALTKNLAVALGPNIRVNGLALGAALPPPGTSNKDPELVQLLPINRWAESTEITNALLFLIESATYTTGEILHLDGGRHLL